MTDSNSHEIKLSQTTNALLNDLKRQSQEMAEADHKEAEEFEAACQKYHHDIKRTIAIMTGYAILIASALVVIYCFVSLEYSFSQISRDKLCNYVIPLSFFLLCLIAFPISTAWSYWNFWKRKRAFIMACIALFTMLFAILLYTLLYMIIVPLVHLPEPNQWVTRERWDFLACVLTTMPTIICSIFLFQKLYFKFFNENFLVKVYDYHILDHIDLRKNKKFLYDTSIIWNLNTGKKWLIKESDRNMHIMINGTSGSGKTSSGVIPMINGDLKILCKNIDMQKKLAWKGVKEGHLRLNRPVTDRHFTIDAFDACDNKGKAILKFLRNYHRIGMTIIGPDDSLTDHAYNLCACKNIPCNRVDPLPDKNDEAKHKSGFLGFNPLFISTSLSELAHIRQVFKVATRFADVMEFINELKGKGDPYFTSINHSMTVSFSVCLAVTFPILDGRQPTLADVQEMVNDFSRIRPYYNKLIEINRNYKNNPYGFVIDFISYDILGRGADEMKKHSRGLRMILDNFLANPLIKEALCPSDDKTIDFDKMLEEGQISVLNYALELGDSDSKGFGLFFLLSFFDAVYRRNGAEGSAILPHVLVIDELPVILNPQFEKALSLFRKYKVSIVCTIQSLDQMAKNKDTQYLGNLFLEGCATHIVFGRCSATDMKRYSELAGKKWVEETSYSQTETSITVDDPTLTYTTRKSTEQRDVMEPTAIRYRGFQEATVFSVRNGSAVKPFVGKVEFLKKTENNWMKRPVFKWKKYYDDIYESITEDQENTEQIPSEPEPEVAMIQEESNALNDGYQEENGVDPSAYTEEPVDNVTVNICNADDDCDDEALASSNEHANKQNNDSPDDSFTTVCSDGTILHFNPNDNGGYTF